MRLWPVPAEAETPAVDNVADEINRLGIVMPKKIQEQIGLASLRAKVKV